MGYLGTKPANSPLTSELIPDGMIGTSDLANGAVTQDKLSTYIAPKGTPAFSAYIGSNQSLSANTWTKLQFSTEQFDTASCFDNATNYRFTPNVAGYYFVNVQWTVSTTMVQISGIYKNGTQYLQTQSASGSFDSLSCTPIYMNGTTDYIEAYGFATTVATANASSTRSLFSAFMIRAA